MSASILSRNVPDISLDAIRRRVGDLYGIDGDFAQVNSERDLTYRIRMGANTAFVLKISNVAEPEEIVDLQVRALEHIARADPEMCVPRVVPTRLGRHFDHIAAASGELHIIRLLTYIEGDILQDVFACCQDKPRFRRNLGAFVGRLGLSLRNFFHPAAGSNAHVWDLGAVHRLRPHLSDIRDPHTRRLCAEVLDAAESRIYPALLLTRHQIIHQDAHQGNLLVAPDDPTRIVGVIDFGDMLYGSRLADLATAADCYLDDDTDPVQILCEVSAGFDDACPLDDNEIDLVYDMSLLRLTNTVIVASARQAIGPVGGGDTHLGGAEKHARMLDRSVSMGRDAGARRLRNACRFPVPARLLDAAEPLDAHRARLVEARRRNLGDIWHFYAEPLNLTRGDGAWLYASDGRSYLDAYNNVPQVGHCHPHIAKAIARQAAALNTNTRYISDITAEYAARLLASLPSEFDVCIFVNSGSEANDVAAQMARFATGATGAIVMEDAYHGITQATAELSPLTAALHHAAIEGLLPPDMYRGPHAGQVGAAALYAADCDRAIGALAARGHAPAFLMIDAALCSSGVPNAPDDYFERIAMTVRQAGGLVIADEVQAGLGRLGQFWGFMAQGMTSVDIITMGKPIGNGHPLGAVITRRALWEQFNAATEVFSTFGGNAVSCAAGMAVLDVVERDHLIEKSNRVGDFFRTRLRELAEYQPLIGDIRGKGMLIGLELVTCRATRAPAKHQTAGLVEAMRARGVLVGAAGRHRNILKLRPSFAWDTAEVEIFIERLGDALSSMDST